MSRSLWIAALFLALAGIFLFNQNIVSLLDEPTVGYDLSIKLTPSAASQLDSVYVRDLSIRYPYMHLTFVFNNFSDRQIFWDHMVIDLRDGNVIHSYNSGYYYALYDLRCIWNNTHLANLVYRYTDDTITVNVYDGNTLLWSSTIDWPYAYNYYTMVSCSDDEVYAAVLRVYPNSNGQTVDAAYLSVLRFTPSGAEVVYETGNLLPQPIPYTWYFDVYAVDANTIDVLLPYVTAGPEVLTFHFDPAATPPLVRTGATEVWTDGVRPVLHTAVGPYFLDYISGDYYDCRYNRAIPALLGAYIFPVLLSGNVTYEEMYDYEYNLTLPDGYRVLWRGRDAVSAAEFNCSADGVVSDINYLFYAFIPGAGFAQVLDVNTTALGYVPSSFAFYGDQNAYIYAIGEGVQSTRYYPSVKYDPDRIAYLGGSLDDSNIIHLQVFARGYDINLDANTIYESLIPEIQNMVEDVNLTVLFSSEEEQSSPAPPTGGGEVVVVPSTVGQPPKPTAAEVAVQPASPTAAGGVSPVVVISIVILLAVLYYFSRR